MIIFTPMPIFNNINLRMRTKITYKRMIHRMTQIRLSRDMITLKSNGLVEVVVGLDKDDYYTKYKVLKIK